MKNSQLIDLFNHFKDDPKLYPSFYQDGCVFRTKAICDYLLNNKEFENEKVLFARISPVQNKGRVTCLKAPLKNKKKTKISWDEHWVPLVFDEKNEMIVLDICLMNGPEKLSDYLKNFDNAEIKKADICNAKNQMDYYLLEMRSNARKDLEDMAKNPYNAYLEIMPNSVKSNWLKNQKKSRSAAVQQVDLSSSR